MLRAELELTRGKMEEVRALAQELMSARGENCQAQVRPKVEQLNQKYETIAQRITCGQVGRAPVVREQLLKGFHFFVSCCFLTFTPDLNLFATYKTQIILINKFQTSSRQSNEKKNH